MIILIVKIDGYYHQVLITGRKCSEQELRQKYIKAKNLCCDIKDLPVIFCRIHHFYQLNYEEDMELDFVIDTLNILSEAVEIFLFELDHELIQIYGIKIDDLIKEGGFLEYRVDLVSSLRSKKVKVTEISKWGTYLRKKWEEEFADHLSDKEKKSIYLYDEDGACGYLWHIFSNKRRDCLKEEQADIALNRVSKKACYVFYQHTDDAYILEYATAIIADDFVNEEDVYVVDKEFNWTYVRTHETGWCGPYYCQK